MRVEHSATAVAPEQSMPGAWFTLWVLVVVGLFSFVDRQILALLTEDVATSLALRDTQMGLIQGLGAAAFAVLAIYPLGWLTDRFDRRWVLGCCILVWSMGTAACGLAQDFSSLSFAVFAISAGEAGLPALAYSAIPDLFAGRRRLVANQVFYIAMILGAAAAMAFGGAADLALKALKNSLPSALDAYESWRLVFFLVAAPAPILIALVAVSRLGARPAVRQRLAVDSKSDLGKYFREHGGKVALIVTALSFYQLPFLAILTWSPAALTRMFAVSPSENGLGLGLGLGLGCIVGVALAGWLTRRLSPGLGDRTPLRISFVTLLASLPLAVLFPFVASPWQAFVMIGALMASGTLIGSLLPGILQSLAPPKLRGRIVALYSIVAVIVQGVGVSLVGPFSDQLPNQPGALLIGVAIVLTVSWTVGAVLMRLSEGPFERLQIALGEPQR